MDRPAYALAGAPVHTSRYSATISAASGTRGLLPGLPDASACVCHQLHLAVPVGLLDPVSGGGRHRQFLVQRFQAGHQFRRRNGVRVALGSEADAPGGLGIARLGARHRPAGDRRQQHGVGQPVRHMEMRADRPRHAVHQRHRAVGERQPRLRRAEHHALARGGVARLGIGGADVLADQLHRRQRERIGERIGALGDIGLQRVGEAVHAGVGGGARRHGVGEFVIHDRRQRQRAEAGDQHLLVMFRVGDDGEAGALAAGAGGGGDGDDRQRSVVGGDRRLVVAHLAAAGGRVGGEDRHRLGGVDRRAAAEADQAVVAVPGAQFGDAGLDHRVGRVGDGVGEHPGGDAGGGQGFQRALDQAGGDHDRVGHHQRAGQAELAQDLGDLAHRAAADQQEAGRGDGGVDGGHGRVPPGWSRDGLDSPQRHEDTKGLRANKCVNRDAAKFRVMAYPWAGPKAPPRAGSGRPTTSFFVPQSEAVGGRPSPAMTRGVRRDAVDLVVSRGPKGTSSRVGAALIWHHMMRYLMPSAR